MGRWKYATTLVARMTKANHQSVADVHFRLSPCICVWTLHIVRLPWTVDPLLIQCTDKLWSQGVQMIHLSQAQWVAQPALSTAQRSRAQVQSWSGGEAAPLGPQRAIPNNSLHFSHTQSLRWRRRQEKPCCVPEGAAERERERTQIYTLTMREQRWALNIMSSLETSNSHIRLLQTSAVLSCSRAEGAWVTMTTCRHAAAPHADCHGLETQFSHNVLTNLGASVFKWFIYLWDWRSACEFRLRNLIDSNQA